MLPAVWCSHMACMQGSANQAASRKPATGVTFFMPARMRGGVHTHAGGDSIAFAQAHRLERLGGECRARDGVHAPRMTAGCAAARSSRTGARLRLHAGDGSVNDANCATSVKPSTGALLQVLVVVTGVRVCECASVCVATSKRARRCEHSAPPPHRQGTRTRARAVNTHLNQSMMGRVHRYGAMRGMASTKGAKRVNTAAVRYHNGLPAGGSTDTEERLMMALSVRMACTPAAASSNHAPTSRAAAPTRCMGVRSVTGAAQQGAMKRPAGMRGARTRCAACAATKARQQTDRTGASMASRMSRRAATVVRCRLRASAVNSSKLASMLARCERGAESPDRNHSTRHHTNATLLARPRSITTFTPSAFRTPAPTNPNLGDSDNEAPKNLLETFQLSDPNSILRSTYKFSLIQKAARAMSVSTKVSVRI
ncbi:hypothetical protein EON67_08295, partial [archaeon]